MNDGVSNLAVIHDDGDAAGQTDSHGGNEHGLRAGQQAVSNLTAAEAGDDTADDAADEVHGGHLEEAPAPLQAAVHHQGDGDDEDHQNQLAAQGEFQFRVGGVLQVGVIVAVHDALGGVLLDPLGVAQHEPDGDAAQHHQADHAVAQAGEEFQTADGLGIAHGVEVGGAGGPAHDVGYEDDGHTGDDVIPQHQGHAHADGNKGDGALQHGGEGADAQEEDHDAGQYKLAALVAGAPGHAHQGGADGAGAVNEADGGADGENHTDEGNTVLNAQRDGLEHLKEIYGSALHIVEAVGVHGGHAIDGDRVILTGWQNPGQYRHQDQDGKQNDKRVGKFPFFLFCQGFVTQKCSPPLNFRVRAYSEATVRTLLLSRFNATASCYHACVELKLKGVDTERDGRR